MKLATLLEQDIADVANARNGEEEAEATERFHVHARHAKLAGFNIGFKMNNDRLEVVLVKRRVPTAYIM